MKKAKTRSNGAFERTRRALISSIVARAGGRATGRVIPFSNDDVPTFLRELDKFETRSSNVVLVVK